jgi:hypothetical protein
MRGVQWRGVVVALALAVGLSAPGFAGATTAPGQAGGSFTTNPADGSTQIASAGTGDVQITWSASCPNPAGDQFHYWYVESKAFHQDGTTVNYHSTAESDGSKTSDSRTDGLVLTMAQGLQVETFRIEVHLTSCNGVQDQLLGTSSVTLIRNSCTNSASSENRYAKVQREFDLADQFHKLGEKELKDARTDVKTFAKEYAKETVVEVGIKLTLLKALKRFAPAAFAVLEAPVEALAAAVTVEEILLKGIPLWADYVRAVTAANDDLARGDSYAAKAAGDLQAAQDLCLDPDEQQLNKLLGDETRDQRAHQVIQQWQGDANRNLNSVTHALNDEATAVKDATSHLGAGHASAAGKAVTITTVQLRAAIRDLNRALVDDRAVRTHLAAITSAQDATLTQLKAVFGS